MDTISADVVAFVERETGCLLWTPRATIARLLEHIAKGGRIELEDLADAPGASWLTLQQAAELLHVRDFPGISGTAAYNRVYRAAKRGEFKTTGEKANKRIDPLSFKAWRLEQRDRDLDREEREDGR